MPVFEVGALGSHLELCGVPVVLPLGDGRQAPADPGAVTPSESVRGRVPRDSHEVPVVLLVLAVEGYSLGFTPEIKLLYEQIVCVFSLQLHISQRAYD